MPIVENIRRYASEQKLSLTQIEVNSGLGNGTIGKWNKSKPTVETLLKVANTLGCSIEDLLKD